jgi:Carboxypeptidase regulatory-like domain
MAPPYWSPKSSHERENRMFDRPSIISFASLRRIAACTLLAACFAFPQSNSGAITGRVTDQDGAAVSGASIQAKNTNTGTIYKATSSSSGDYKFEGLPAGSYQISFPTLVVGAPPQNVVVQAGQASHLDLSTRDASLNTLGEDRSFFAARVAPHPTPKGPAPRTQEGKPDLSGVWWAPRIVAREEASLLPWAASTIKEWAANNFKDIPSARCLPSGWGLTFLHSFGLNKLIQTPTLLVNIGEMDVSASRQVFLDGRGHPKDLDPSWMGQSVGTWEGDTLVVDTIGFNGKGWISDTIPNAFPYTEKLHLTSRFRRPDLGHLEIDVTFEDPGTFTKPWTMKTVADLAQSEELQEFICTENNQDAEHLVGK